MSHEDAPFSLAKYIMCFILGHISLYATNDDVYLVCAVRVLEYGVELCGDILSRPSVERKDSFHGLRSALSAGCHVIAKRGSVPEEKLAMAHRIVSNLNEITLELIEELLQEKI